VLTDIGNAARPSHASRTSAAEASSTPAS